MFVLLNLIVFGILVAFLSISSGLTCYSCVYSPNTDGTDVNLSSFNASYTKSCLEPDKEKAPTVACNTTELTCAKGFMTLTVTNPNSGNPETVKLVIRTCSYDRLPIEGQECEQRSRSDQTPDEFTKMAKAFLASRNLNPEARTKVTTSFKATVCLCEKDKCNNQPGLEASKSNNIETGTLLPAVALAFCLCFLLNYFPFSKCNMN